MNIKVVLEAKLKEGFYREGVFEYQKRLLGRVETVEVQNILEYIKNKNNAYIITLEIEKEGYYNEILFLIGASEGLSDEVRAKSNFKFSMSKLTFLHQEAVLILMEQIYRAYKILNNEPYHK